VHEGPAKRIFGLSRHRTGDGVVAAALTRWEWGRSAPTGAAHGCAHWNRWGSGRTALLVGPVFFWILSGREPRDLDPRDLVGEFLRVAAPSSSWT